MKASDIEEKLRSKEKWFLGGSKTVIWSPQFPRYLHNPGFWDYVFWLDTPLPHLYTVTFLRNNKPLSLKVQKRSWVPSHLTTEYKTVQGIKITEDKAVLPDDTLVSYFKILNNSKKAVELDAVMWGFTEGTDKGPDRLDSFRYKEGQFQFTKHIFDRIQLKIVYSLDGNTNKWKEYFRISGTGKIF